VHFASCLFTYNTAAFSCASTSKNFIELKQADITVFLAIILVLIKKCSSSQGRRQKIFQGEGATEKRPKINTKIPKNSTICLFQGGNGKKDRKIAKKGRKAALFRLYLLYFTMYENSGGGGEGRPFLSPAADTHGSSLFSLEKPFCYQAVCPSNFMTKYVRSFTRIPYAINLL